jgi:hypothetical protein
MRRRLHFLAGDPNLEAMIVAVATNGPLCAIRDDSGSTRGAPLAFAAEGIDKGESASGRPIQDILRTLIAACGVFCSAACAAAQNHNIRAFDFSQYFNRRYAECLESSAGRNAVDNLSVAFHDFAGDGSEQAMVAGSSCHTGTAGPDIHSVFRLRRNGQIEELKIREERTFTGRSIYDDLVGNRNFLFKVRNGRLCEAFSDGSGRDRPLTVCYKLRGDEFVIDHIERGPVYRASFDCAKARSERARTVCGTK